MDKLHFKVNPAQRMGGIFERIATRASQLNDPELNVIMCEGKLYNIADPDYVEYDPARILNMMEQAKLIVPDVESEQQKQLDEIQKANDDVKFIVITARKMMSCHRVISCVPVPGKANQFVSDVPPRNIAYYAEDIEIKNGLLSFRAKGLSGKQTRKYVLPESEFELVSEIVGHPTNADAVVLLDNSGKKNHRKLNIKKVNSPEHFDGILDLILDNEDTPYASFLIERKSIEVHSDGKRTDYNNSEYIFVKF